MTSRPRPIAVPSSPQDSVPAHLESATAEWWMDVVAEYGLEAHHIRLLTLAAEAWDRGQAARAVIDEEGLTFDDRFDQPKVRPQVAIERDSRTAFARLLRELALDYEEPLSTPRPTSIPNMQKGGE